MGKNVRPVRPKQAPDSPSAVGRRGGIARPRLPDGRPRVELRKDAAAAAATKISVLLVEDDKSVAESTRRLLESEGLRVECAFGGSVGLAKALGGFHDVILLDRMLPDIRGDEVLERLRANGNSTPVVILTGFPDYESALHAGRFNVSDYLVKSAITGADLAASIRKATANAGAPDAAETKTRLFSAYGDNTSRSFSDLADYVRSDEVNASDLPQRLARTISARDLTFAEFLAASKSLHLLNRKARLPFHLALLTLRDWLKPISTGREVDSKLEELLARLETAGPNWPKVRPADVTGDVHSDGHVAKEFGANPARPTFNQCRKAVVMRRAVLALLGPHEQIRQIAYGLGYSNHGNFDHDFFHLFGVTPSQFRRLV